MRKLTVLAIVFFMVFVNGMSITLNETNNGNVGDTLVYSGAGDTNYGTQNWMQARDASTVYAFTLFNVSGFLTPGVTILSATLKLYEYDITIQGNLNCYNSTTAWNETNVTWNNKPASDTLQQTVASGAVNGVWISWDVTNAVKTAVAQSKNVSLLITSTTGNSYFSTKEDLNTTSQKPQLVITYGLGSILNFTVFNESNSTQKIYFDITIANTTTSSSYYGQQNFSQFINDLPYNSVTVTVSNSSHFYSPRYYYTALANSTDKNVSGYLLHLNYLYATSTSIFVRNSGGSSIDGAIVTIQRNFGSGYTTIAQDTSDSVGGTYFNLDATVPYQVIINATGYDAVSYVLQPTQSVYTFTLTSNTTTTSYFATDYQNVFFNLTPNYYYISGVVNFNFSIYDEDNNLSFWGMNVTYNGSLQYTTNQTTSSGGHVNYSLNTSLVNSTTINVSIFFFKNGTLFDPRSVYTPYFIYAGDLTLIGAMERLKTSGLGRFSLGMLAIVVTAIIVGYVGIAVSFPIGVLVAITMMWFFAFFDYISFIPTIAITLIGLFLVWGRTAPS